MLMTTSWSKGDKEEWCSPRVLLVNRENFVVEVAIGVCLDHSDHGMVELKIFDDRKKSATKT